MDFGEATDRLMACPSLRDVAESAGANYQTVRQARLTPEHPNNRQPPKGWEKAVAKLAEERAQELQALAEELRRAADE